MSEYVLLNNVEHADVKVVLDRAPEFGDDVMFCMTFPFEFRLALAKYPIMIYQDLKTDVSFPVALFGFEEGENLFLTEHGWDASYIPMMIQRQPFLIGFQQQSGSTERQKVISFNPHHPRVNTEVGEPVFNEHGGYTPYLDKVVKILESIDTGQEQNQVLMEALNKYELLEPTTFEITLNDGSGYELIGFSTIADDRFEALSAEALDDLNQQGLLIPITMMMASLSQVRSLIDRKNNLIK